MGRPNEGKTSPKKLAYIKAWQAAHREEKRAYLKAYYQAHQTEQSAKERARYAALKDDPEFKARNKASQDKWKAANPERRRTVVANNHAAAHKARPEGRHTTEEWLALVESFDGCCAYCGERKKLERDHVVPLARGGSNWISNIRPSCRSCNARKHNRLPAEWLELEALPGILTDEVA